MSWSDGCTVDNLRWVVLSEEDGVPVETVYVVDSGGNATGITLEIDATDRTQGNYRFAVNGYDTQYYCNRCRTYFPIWRDVVEHLEASQAPPEFYSWWR